MQLLILHPLHPKYGSKKDHVHDVYDAHQLPSEFVVPVRNSHDEVPSLHIHTTLQRGHPPVCSSPW